MTEPPEIERAVGMECYATTTPPCPARLKSSPEDFSVEESLEGLAIEETPKQGYVPLYRIEKRGIDTLHLERELGDSLKSRVVTAGLKDKAAVAVQYATPTSTRSERPLSINGNNFSAKLVGYVPRPIARSSLVGNRFMIVLRDCCSDIGDRLTEIFALGERMLVPNFFGLQRFGGRGILTHRVGRAIVLKRFDEAIRLLLLEPRQTDGPDSEEARRAMEEGRFEEGLRLLPPGQDIEKRVARALSIKPGDSLGALRAVPIRVRKLYTQAFQSYLFNRTLSAALKGGLDISTTVTGDNWGEVAHGGMVVSKVHGVKEPILPGSIPLVQFPGFAYRDYGSRFDKCAEAVMAEEGVAARDFYVKDLQEVSVEGGFRRPSLVLRDGSSERTGEHTVVRFVLGKGSYATVLLREVVKPADPAAAGFA